MPVPMSTRWLVVVAAAAVGLSILSEVTPAMAQQHSTPSGDLADFPHSTSGLGPLTDSAITRLLISDQVAASKFGTDQPIDDPAREQQELDQVRQQAVDLGIDPTSTVQFFQDQISASKIVQRGLFRLWTAHPDLAPTTRPNLGTIRQELDRLTAQILDQLRSTQDIRVAGPLCRVRLASARLSGELTSHLDAVHRHALDVALKSVCSPS